MQNLWQAVFRFFGVFLFLAAIAVLNIVDIETGRTFEKMILALTTGAFSLGAGQVVWERFFKTTRSRLAVLLGFALPAYLYYLFAQAMPQYSQVANVTAAVLCFIFFMLFLFVPCVYKNADFDEVFMTVFKAVFTCVFFTGVIFGGVSLIIAAVDRLLFSGDSHAYIHTANLLWIVWAPMLLLSMVPNFSGGAEEKARAEKASKIQDFWKSCFPTSSFPRFRLYGGADFIHWENVRDRQLCR